MPGIRRTKGLTKKQEIFCREYAVRDNGLQSAILAGYSKKSANGSAFGLLQLPHIQKYIQLLRDEQRAEAQKKQPLVTLDYIIGGLKEVTERCLQRKPVMRFDWDEKQLVQETNEHGEGVWTFDSSGANKALELLGRHLGAFEKDNAKDQPIIEVTVVNNNNTIVVNQQQHANNGAPEDTSAFTDRGVYTMLPPITE